MKKKSVMFIPETIDLGQSEKYDLSIRIRPDGFMFSISEPDAGSNYCLRETTFSEETLLKNVQKIIFDLNFLTQQFHSTKVVLVSPDYDIIPIEFYQNKADKKNAIFNFVHYPEASHILSYENVRQRNVTLFSVDSELYEFLFRSLYNPVFIHHTNSLIDLFENKGKSIHLTSRMFVNFHDDILDIICFSKTKMIYCMSYQEESAYNQLYYILKLWESCGFDQLNDWIHVVGEPEKKVMEGIQAYIKNIETSNFPTEAFLWNKDAQKTPLDLLALSL